MPNLLQKANELSIRISDALTPLTPETSTLAVVILENYIEEIKKEVGFSKETYGFIKMILKQETHIIRNPEENTETIEALKRYAMGNRKEIYRGKL